MGINFEIFTFIFSVMVLAFLIYKTVKFYKNDQNIYDLISDHYENEELYVEGISKLNFSEKIKYGVPLSSVFTLRRNSFGIVNQESSYARKVELIDVDENTYTKYIELVMNNGALSSFNEFDSYDI